MGNKDKTGNERQQRRRKREKEWLKEHGFKSWEALHTALMSGETSRTQYALDWANAPSSEQDTGLESDPANEVDTQPRK